MQQVPNLTLPFTPEGKTERLTVRAIYFAGQLDLKAFRAKHLHYPVLAADPLVVEPVRGSIAVMAKFGAIVFWNCGTAVEEEIVKGAREIPGAADVDVALEDKLDVIIGQPENRVTFNEIELRRLTLDNLKIISLALAQSVALDRIEHEVELALRRFEPVVADLREGRLAMTEKEVIPAIGFSLEVRQDVLANLTLFDKPPETWESEALDRLDTQLYDFFDLEERLSAINQKVAYFSEVNSTLLGVLNHRKSVRLEWIIIILILIEVIIVIFNEVRHRL